jgi:hypothetical protein
MGDFEVRTTQATSSNGAVAPAAINFRRALVTTPDVLQWVLEGRVYTANIGTLTGTVSFAETTINYLRPACALRVPTGITIIPLMVQVLFQATGGALMEGAIRTLTDDIGAGTSTAITPINNNTAFTSMASGIIVDSIYSGDAAGAGIVANSNEVFRFGNATDLDATPVGDLAQMVWNPLGKKGVPCVVKGTGSLAINVANATSSTGFMVVTWAEFRTVDLGL